MLECVIAEDPKLLTLNFMGKYTILCYIIL